MFNNMMNTLTIQKCIYNCNVLIKFVCVNNLSNNNEFTKTSNFTLACLFTDTSSTNTPASSSTRGKSTVYRCSINVTIYGAYMYAIDHNTYH